MKKNDLQKTILSIFLSLVIVSSLLTPLTAYATANNTKSIGDTIIDQARSAENVTVADPPFVDVNTGDYYREPVVWAVARGITQGTSPNTFSPDSSCTRAQIVTFLWRAMGSPEPSAAVSPFEDVADQSAYYYKPVLWACENGITSGISKTQFGPNTVCTRGQVVAFLHKTAKTPPHSAVNPFQDVAKDSYYCNAALWAYENNITAGVSETSFAPNNVCTRGQIVTFLYRAQTFFETNENTEILWNWQDSFEIKKTAQVADIADRLVPNHRYYLTVKDGADWKPNNFEETTVSYRYNVKRFYYTIGTNGEITLDSNGQLTETKTETKTIGKDPCLLAEKGVHGHTSGGQFFVHLPTDIEIIRVETKQYPESLDHYITFEANGLISPGLAKEIQDLLYETYPSIFEYFANGQYEKISCEIKSFDGVAYTSGRKIVVNGDYLNAHPKDLDCITHEVIHCAQNYGGNSPGWLTEGIADYGRYLFGIHNEDSGWKLPKYSEKQSYTNSYRVTAAFLNYVTEHHAEDFVRALNTALQSNTYTEAFWKEHTGYTVDELWELYAKANS